MRDTYADSIKAAYHENSAALLAYATALHPCREAAEDAVHDVFARILKNRPRVDEWRPYLFRAVRNACMDGRRNQQREERSQARLHLLDADPADMQERLAIEDALGQLSANHRECIVLKIYMGFTFSELGSICGVPANTAASWHRRGLQPKKGSRNLLWDFSSPIL